MDKKVVFWNGNKVTKKEKNNKFKVWYKESLVQREIIILSSESRNPNNEMFRLFQ